MLYIYENIIEVLGGITPTYPPPSSAPTTRTRGKG